MKILIIDNDKDNLLLHKIVIRRLASDSIIKTANNGEEGLAIAKEATEPFDLIITEYLMPKMNGGDMIEAIKKFQPDILSLCITSDTLFKHEKEFDFSLQKPIHKEDVRSILIKLLLKLANNKRNKKNDCTER
jgi:YesN/AraC family two-component response regulator